MQAELYTLYMFALRLSIIYCSETFCSCCPTVNPFSTYTCTLRNLHLYKYSADGYLYIYICISTFVPYLSNFIHAHNALVATFTVLFDINYLEEKIRSALGRIVENDCYKRRKPANNLNVHQATHRDKYMLLLLLLLKQ